MVLGFLLFGMSCFWAYIAFSQLMLIWYGNLPEETHYILTRLAGPVARAHLALAILRFFVPFLLLLGRAAKSDVAHAVLLIGLLVVAGQLLDLYWIVMPEAPGRRGRRCVFAEAGPSCSWWACSFLALPGLLPATSSSLRATRLLAHSLRLPSEVRHALPQPL